MLEEVEDFTASSNTAVNDSVLNPSAATFQAVRPLLEAMGKTIVFYAAAVLGGGGDTISATPVIFEPAKGKKT